MRRTKIVATVGPASRSPQKLEQLVQAGVNVFRLNFSHGSHDEHLAVITSVRQIAEPTSPRAPATNMLASLFIRGA